MLGICLKYFGNQKKKADEGRGERFVLSMWQILIFVEAIW